MESTAAAKDRIWQELQSTERSRKDVERRSLVKNFLLVAALLVLTLAVVALLGSARHGTGPV
jgi:membrane protein required for beta-lactamase induction